MLLRISFNRIDVLFLSICLIGTITGLAPIATAAEIYVPNYGSPPAQDPTTVKDGDTFTTPFLLPRTEERYYCRIRPLALINDSGFDLAQGVMSGGGTPATVRALPDIPNIEESDTTNNAINIATNEPGAHTWKAVVDNPLNADQVQSSVRCCPVSGAVKYNTLAAMINFLEILSSYNEAINATVIFVATSGTEITRVQVVVPAKGRTDISVHDNVPPGFGTIKIVHDGPADALNGFNAFYDLLPSGGLDLKESVTVKFPLCRN